ncbi:MAG: hypothetical protein WD904_05715 [Dehalococcoidia bacterium]
MTTRTLVLGIPLPNVAFDNASFLSAPSFSEYTRLIIEPAAASRVIDEVVEKSESHQSYGGQAIVNGEASSYAFGLAELLEMRRRETARLVERGGLIVCFGYPDVAHSGVTGEPAWRRFSWLPETEGFSPPEHLLTGFGKPGATLTDEAHPFAPFISALAPKMAYRAYADEDAPALRDRGRVFARSAGDVAIAFDLPVGNGTIVFLPAIEKPEAIRTQVAQAIAECLTAWDAQASPQPLEWKHKEAS